MWWFKNLDKELDKAVDNIDKKIDEIVEERDAAQREVERLKTYVESIFNKLSDEDMVIDFQAINVFSVERNDKDELPCTIIGFLVKDGDTFRTNEWYLYCSARVHANIIKDFEEFKKKRG